MTNTVDSRTHKGEFIKDLKENDLFFGGKIKPEQMMKYKNTLE